MILLKWKICIALFLVVMVAVLVAAISGNDGNDVAACGGQSVSTPSASPAWATIPTTATPTTVAALRRAGAATTAPLAAGFDPAGITVAAQPGGTFGGVALTADQEKMAATIVAVAKAMGLTERAARIGLAVSMQESTFNPKAVNEKFVGLFQQSPPSDGLYGKYSRTDPADSAWMFFDQLVKRVPGYDTDPRPDYTLGEVIQESGVGENVIQWQKMAAALEPVLWSGTAAPVTAAVQPADVTADPGTCNSVQPASTRTDGKNAAWDPANIISDAVFYNTAAMTVPQIAAFITKQGAGCAAGNPWCLKTQKFTYPAAAATRSCKAMPAGTAVTAAQALADASVACGINPQVMLVKLQLESQGLNRSNPDASSLNFAYGWNCPDSGPGGSAACDPDHAGFVNQLHGMANTFANLKVDVPAGKYQYKVGPSTILWNVAESGCGSSVVNIKNIATASLYVYTPYQPNPASLAAYPGTGDKCSSYGNRNFFREFQTFFGDTGGGIVQNVTPVVNQVAVQTGNQRVAHGGGLGPVSVTFSGNTVTIPANPQVPADMVGKLIVAPNPKVAAAIAAGLTWLGEPYSWGGGGEGGPTLGICGPDGAENDCNIVGFDCSGLTRYIAARFGVALPQISGDQRDDAHGVPWAQAVAGDLQGQSGHITMYIGIFNGVKMRLEAPYSGVWVRISPVPMDKTDPVAYRWWTGAAA